MTILNDYYHIDYCSNEGDATVFNITLLSECSVYAGHFPNNPISPGVYNIQMIKELSERITNKRLFIYCIEKCKFSAVITPQTAPHLQACLKVSLVEDNAYQVCATICDTTTVYMKASFVAKTV